MQYKIGKLKVKNRIFLAPMEGINDIAFRILCRDSGAGLVYTGMINPRTKQKLDLDDKPALQLFSSDGKGISEFIKKHEKKVALFDFNLGCPAPTAQKQKFGSFMSHKLELIEKILIKISENSCVPISIKIRKSKNSFKLAKLGEKYCDALCIHPRTQQQGYSGDPDLELAEKIKNKISIPVIYSGNIGINNAEQFLEKFDFIMIGRGSIGNPNIFSKFTNTKSKNFNFSHYLKLAEKNNLKFSQIKLQALNFTKNKKNAKQLREKIFKTKTLKEIKDIKEIIK